ncbi:MAG: hypothetical protein E7388_03485 [Ruminococcaceae bacterium]|nr:hypothetical protein [Oscillospiraceae bacterium]
MKFKRLFVIQLLCILIFCSAIIHASATSAEPQPDIIPGSYLWHDGNYLKGTSVNTTADMLESNFTTVAKIRNANGDDVTGKDSIATGMTLENNVCLTIVVRGDNNGDGKITTADYIRIKSHITGNLVLTNEFLEASNVNYDNKISTEDYMLTKAYLKGASKLLLLPETNLSVECQPVYREQITEKNGTATFNGNVNFNINYNSKFYGHESAMNRDFSYYGSNYKLGQCNTLRNISGEIVCADMNGDSFGDVIILKNGTLSINATTLLKSGKQVYVVQEDLRFRTKLIGEIYVGGDVSLKGAGDVNGDGFNDIICSKDHMVIVYYGSATGFKAFYYPLDCEGTILSGDADGNGCYDIIVANGNSIKTYTVKNNSLTKLFENTVPAIPEDIEGIYAADINSDGICDITYSQIVDGIFTVTSLFGRGDGRYGCYETDGDNKNLYGSFQIANKPLYIAAGDITGNGAADFIAIYPSYVSIYYAYGDPAYDYSLFGMHVNGEYRMYSGARWMDRNIEGSDGDHVLLSTSSDGLNWRRYIDKPMFYLGWELGEDDWWTGNTLEPEVLYVDNMYHMYWQCEIHTPAGNYGDRIGYAYSEDGINWTRKTDEPAIVVDEELDYEIGFNHHEVLYVPDDPDGKPFWIYTGYHVNNAFYGYVRIRSDRPDRFLFSQREETSGFAQIGNQLAYFEDDNGNKVFMRITFNTVVIDGAEYWRPTLFMSRDGLNFVGGDNCELAGVDTNDPKTINNRNMFFYGLITENGTGEILRKEDGSYHFFYLATGCVSSVAPGIYYADAGVGEMTFTISE